MGKTHYRNVMKSDHLGVADIEDLVEAGKPLLFTIAKAQQEIGAKVAGRRIDANIAYFAENIKPLVLNSTNSRVVANICGSPFVEDWVNVAVEIYVDKGVKMKGEVVGGVRLKAAPFKEVMNEQHPKWGEASERVAAGMTLEQIRQFYKITEEDYGKLCGTK